MESEYYEMKRKRETLMKKFSEDVLLKFYSHNAYFRNVCEALVRGADEYAIIEQLIISNSQLLERLKYLEENSKLNFVKKEK